MLCRVENFCLALALDIRFDFLLRRHYMLCLSQCQSDSALARKYRTSGGTASLPKLFLFEPRSPFLTTSDSAGFTKAVLHFQWNVLKNLLLGMLYLGNQNRCFGLTVLMLYLRWPQTVFARALAHAIQRARKDCKKQTCRTYIQNTNMPYIHTYSARARIAIIKHAVDTVISCSVLALSVLFFFIIGAVYW